MRVAVRRELLGAKDARLGEEPLEPRLVEYGTIKQIGEAGLLPPIQGEPSAICEDALGFGHGRVDYEVSQGPLRRRGGMAHELVWPGRDTEDPALGLWHSRTMHASIRSSPSQPGPGSS